MQTKSDCRRRRSKLPEDGSSSTTESVTHLLVVCIDWAWRSSIWRIRRSAFSAEIRGSSGQRHLTNGTATWMMLCSPADTRWRLMVTRSTFITEPQIARSLWLGPVCVHYSIGSTPTEVATAVRERRICETAGLFSSHLWLPAPRHQPGVHH